MSKIAEEDIKTTRRTEDKSVNIAEDMMSTFALNIGTLLNGKDTDIATIRKEVENALLESGYDEAINKITNTSYQELINQSHELYSKISGQENIVLTDEEPNEPA